MNVLTPTTQQPVIRATTTWCAPFQTPVSPPQPAPTPGPGPEREPTPSTHEDPTMAHALASILLACEASPCGAAFLGSQPVSAPAGLAAGVLPAPMPASTAPCLPSSAEALACLLHNTSALLSGGEAALCLQADCVCCMPAVGWPSHGPLSLHVMPSPWVPGGCPRMASLNVGCCVVCVPCVLLLVVC